MLRIITFNANGVRSAERKGFFEWFLRQDADILCLQELKAAEGNVPETLRALPGYRAWFHCASRKGYSGCGLWSRVEPLAVRMGFGDEEFDAEGRCIEADFEGLTVASVYFPSAPRTSGSRRSIAFSTDSARAWTRSRAPAARS